MLVALASPKNLSGRCSLTDCEKCSLLPAGGRPDGIPQQGFATGIVAMPQNGRKDATCTSFRGGMLCGNFRAAAPPQFLREFISNRLIAMELLTLVSVNANSRGFLF